MEIICSIRRGKYMVCGHYIWIRACTKVQLDVEQCGFGKGQGWERWEKKNIEAHRAKSCTIAPAIDALIGDEEQMGKKKR